MKEDMTEEDSAASAPLSQVSVSNFEPTAKRKADEQQTSGSQTPSIESNESDDDSKRVSGAPKRKRVQSTEDGQFSLESQGSAPKRSRSPASLNRDDDASSISSLASVDSMDHNGTRKNVPEDNGTEDKGTDEAKTTGEKSSTTTTTTPTSSQPKLEPDVPAKASEGAPPSVKVAPSNPFLKASQSTTTSWDELVEDDEEIKPKVEAIKSSTVAPKFGAPTFGIPQSSLGFKGSSLGTGSWSSWKDAGKVATPAPSKTTPPSGNSPTAPSKVTNTSFSTPQKKDVGGGYVFGASLTGSRFSQFASAGSSPFAAAATKGTTSTTPPTLASTNTSSEAVKAPTDTGSSVTFESLLVTPHKNPFTKLKMSDEPSATPKGPLMTRLKLDMSARQDTTGEENERHLFQKRGKLFEWVTEGDGSRWAERGRGMVSVNVDVKDPTQGRVLMRADATLRLILNSRISNVFKIKVTTENDKYVEFLTFPLEKKELTKFLIQFKDNTMSSEFESKVRKISEGVTAESSD
ncbi:hypothetical protein DFJ77DRAFT_444575 [Powellomyces hirtus]|nr:hypothetical protein DFJ77DRAFT_444575 [Powellomyces hirtus]